MYSAFAWNELNRHAIQKPDPVGIGLFLCLAMAGGRPPEWPI
jgi:hypothetical protein